MRNYSISIAMATYNGEKYIKEQLDSILMQLNKDDEVIISDDGSKDNTRKIIKSFKDDRIKLIDGPKKGVKQNFANAINKCSGKYIFLADQDDIWKKDKIKKVLESFEKEKAICVVHDCRVFDSSTKKTIYDSFYEYRKSGPGIFKNIIKNTYIGCCMAFDSKYKGKILPIPNNIEMHDQWIGINLEKNGKVTFIKDRLIDYRRHNDNASQMKHYPFSKMIKNRINLIVALLGA